MLHEKTVLILGLANERSIAYGIAEAVRHVGGRVLLTYQNEAMQKRVVPIAEKLGAEVVGGCDVQSAASLDGLFSALQALNTPIDGVVHALAFSNKDELKGRYLDTTLENFLMTMHISVYSFTDILRRLEPLLSNQASALTLSYYGAEKVMPNYNVMGVAKAALEMSVKYLANDLGKNGVRVNAISAGPIRTLAASGISDFKEILTWNKTHAPLRENVTIEDVGQSALYLLSSMSRGVTGEIHYVDCGYNIIGMGDPEALAARGQGGMT